MWVTCILSALRRAHMSQAWVVSDWIIVERNVHVVVWPSIEVWQHCVPQGHQGVSLRSESAQRGRPGRRR